MNQQLTQPILIRRHNIPYNLPFYGKRNQFVQSILSEDHQIIIVEASTGSGKTVLASLMIAESGYKCMITIPTKVATRAIASFISENTLGGTVGIACDGDVNYRNEPIKFVTTKHGFNVLKRVLSNYNKQKKGIKFFGKFKFDDNFVFVLDEAHHTTQENLATFRLAKTALKLGLLKKLIVMSAILSDMDFSGFTTERIVAEGRSFDIDTFFDKKDIDIENQTNLTNEVIRKFDSVCDGFKNILIFVPGASSVEEIASILESRRDPKLKIFRLYSQLDAEETKEVTIPLTDKIKVVISTNIAESAITIPDIDIVIDSCCQKTPYSGTNGLGLVLVLEHCPVSKLLQRKGRSGRTKKGEYYPMLTETTWNCLRIADKSDMERIHPYEIVIELLAENLDAKEILEIDDAVYDSIMQKLIRLELVVKNNDLLSVTHMGKSISKFPYSIENAVIAYKLSQLSQDPIHNLYVLYASICIACIEGSAGNSFFFVPKEHRQNKRDYIDDHFEHLKGNNDFETYINIFLDMFDYVAINSYNSYTYERACVKYAKDNSMNNKLLKKTRKCFIKFVNVLYNTNYKNSDFVRCINDFGINLNRNSEVLTNLYELFASVHTDKVFIQETGNRYYKNDDLYGKIYTIDRARSFFQSDLTCIVALQIMEIKQGKNIRQCMSCIIPCTLVTKDIEES